MTDLLFPRVANIYVGISAAGLFWFVNEFFSSTVATLVVKQSKFASEKVSDSLGKAQKAAIRAVVVPFNVALIYLQQLFTFLIMSWVWVVVFGVLLSFGFLLLNFQQQTIVAVDTLYEDLYVVLIAPLKWCINLLALVLQIAVAILNFISQFTSTVTLQVANDLLECPGYFPGSREG